MFIGTISVHLEAPRDTAGHHRTPRDTTIHYEPPRDTTTHQEPLRDVPRCSEAFRVISRHFKTLRDTSRHSDTPRKSTQKRETPYHITKHQSPPRNSTQHHETQLHTTKHHEPPRNTTPQSLFKLMSIELMMPCNHLILCHLLFLLPSIFPSIRIFSNDSVLHIRWPKYWSFSFSISPSNEYSGLISLRIDGFYLLVMQGTPKSLLQHHSSKASVLQCLAFL